MSHPRFSVLMVNYNKGKYIVSAINSVKEQAYKNWELIICDDGSTDDSRERIKPFLSDDRIKFLINNNNSGKIRSLRKMIKEARGDIVIILDSDDMLSPDALTEVDRAYKEKPACGFVYSQMVFCDENMNEVATGNSKKIPPGKSYLHYDCILQLRSFERELYYQTTGYDKDCLYAEDVDMILKMEELTDFCFIDKILYYYRVYKDSQSHSSSGKSINRSSVALAKLNAYKRRQNTNIPNLNKGEIAGVICLGILFSRLSRQQERASFFVKELKSIHPLFFLFPDFYVFLLLKIFYFFKNRLRSVP